jgi:hypothetical protein
MNMNNETTTVLKKGFLVFGVLAAIGLLGYGFSYIIVMPQVSPDGFVPTMPGNSSENTSGFGTVLAAFILLYAFAFLPVTTLFTVKKYSVNPHALVFAGCLAGISSLIEIFNSLPLVAKGIYPGKLESIPAEVLLYLQQVEAIRFLAFDVAGFMLIYAASLVYAIVFFRSQRLLFVTVIASIILFLVNVPCLWFAPNAAVILMVLSIFALAPVPVILARMTIDGGSREYETK